jgi:hypothetical protein
MFLKSRVLSLVDCIVISLVFSDIRPAARGRALLGGLKKEHAYSGTLFASDPFPH